MSGPASSKGGPKSSSGSTSSASPGHEPGPHDLILTRLHKRALGQPEAPALMQRNDAGSFVPVTWAEYHDLVQSFAAACIAVGLPVGGAVGVIGRAASSGWWRRSAR